MSRSVSLGQAGEQQARQLRMTLGSRPRVLGRHKGESRSVNAVLLLRYFARVKLESAAWLSRRRTHTLGSKARLFSHESIVARALHSTSAMSYLHREYVVQSSWTSVLVLLHDTSLRFFHAVCMDPLIFLLDCCVVFRFLVCRIYPQMCAWCASCFIS